MRTIYNLIAGQSLRWEAALSDGIFAVVTTLLVLDLCVPVSAVGGAIRSEQALWEVLIGLLLEPVMNYR